MSPVSRTRKPCTHWVICSCRKDTSFLQNGLACVPAETAKETQETRLKGNGGRQDSRVKKEEKIVLWLSAESVDSSSGLRIFPADVP